MNIKIFQSRISASFRHLTIFQRMLVWLSVTLLYEVLIRATGQAESMSVTQLPALAAFMFFGSYWLGYHAYLEGEIAGLPLNRGRNLVAH